MKSKLLLLHLPTPDELARAAAVKLHGLLHRRSDLSKPFGIALSGGRIARDFYEEIVKATRQSATRFDEVHFFWADERCVPPTDPENNYRTARQFLFEPLQIPVANVHRIQGERDDRFAVKEAEAEICRLMPLSSTAQPILDLIILGMGEDGHVASLFPEEGLEFVEDAAVYRKVIATKPPPARITLGYQPTIAAREVWVLASGIGKLAAFRGLLAGDERLPIARVVANREQTVVFQDFEKSAE